METLECLPKAVSLTFWLGFIALILIAGSIYVIAELFPRKYRAFHYSMVLFTGISALSYLAQANGIGIAVFNDHPHCFFALRWIDFMLTLPIAVLALSLVSTTYASSTLFLMGMSSLMVAAGVLGGLVHGHNHWLFFAFNLLAFVPLGRALLVRLCCCGSVSRTLRMLRMLRMQRNSCFVHECLLTKHLSHEQYGFRADAASMVDDVEVEKRSALLSSLLLAYVLAYQLLYVLAESFHIVHSDVAALIMTTVDVLVKMLFPALLLGHRHVLDTIVDLWDEQSGGGATGVTGTTTSSGGGSYLDPFGHVGEPSTSTTKTQASSGQTPRETSALLRRARGGVGVPADVYMTTGAFEGAHGGGGGGASGAGGETSSITFPSSQHPTTGAGGYYQGGGDSDRK